jgi:hypothetical protein
MHKVIFIFILVSLAIEAHACSIKDTSIAYFFPFDAHTYVPIKKNDIEYSGAKVVIVNSYFKKLLDSILNQPKAVFSGNVRMKIIFHQNIYYIDQQGVVEVNNSVIGKLDKKNINSLNFGFNFYEFETCRPFNEVLAEEYKNIKSKKINPGSKVYGNP